VTAQSFSSFFLASDGSAPRLRIGICTDGDQVSEAAAIVIEDIGSCNFATIELMIFSSADPPSHRPLGPRTFQLYARLDRRRMRRLKDPDAIRAVPPALRSVDTVRLGREGESVDDGVKDQMQAAHLDVIVRLGRREPPDWMLALARHGVWSLEDGARPQPGIPPLATQLFDHDPLTIVILRHVNESGGPGRVLAKGVFATEAGSYAKNRAQATFGSTHLVIQKLRQLHQHGWDALASASEPAPPRSGPTRVSNRRVLRWILPLVARRAANAVALRVGMGSVEHWRFAVRPASAGSLLVDRPDMTGFRWIEAPRGHFYADPFLVDDDSRSWVFYEDYDYAKRRGVIASSEVRSDGTLGGRQTVLARNGHLSYPCVFREGDAFYMIPETAFEQAARLFRAAALPGPWEDCGVLYRGSALDTSVLKHDGLWWFFTTLREPRGKAMMLMLFWSASLNDPWQLHPSAPISLDVRNVRCAGAIFRDGQRLIRPSQDGSRTYGYSFDLNEIVTLTRTEYVERPVAKVLPDWEAGLVGTHTYNRGRIGEVTDGKVLRRVRDVR
jgi:hypothetical protein